METSDHTIGTFTDRIDTKGIIRVISGSPIP